MASCCSVVAHRFQHVEGVWAALRWNSFCKCHRCNLVAAECNSSDIQNKANWGFALRSHLFDLWVSSVVWQLKYYVCSNQSVVCIRRSFFISTFLDSGIFSNIQASNTNMLSETNNSVFSLTLLLENVPLSLSVAFALFMLTCLSMLAELRVIRKYTEGRELIIQTIHSIYECTI